MDGREKKCQGQIMGGPAGHYKDFGFHSEIGTIETTINNGLLS